MRARHRQSIGRRARTRRRWSRLPEARYGSHLLATSQQHFSGTYGWLRAGCEVSLMNAAFRCCAGLALTSGWLADLEVAHLPQRLDLLGVCQRVPIGRRFSLPLSTARWPLWFARRQSTRDEWCTFRHFGPSKTAWLSHAPGTIRTCGLCLRRAALYPLSYGRILSSWERPRAASRSLGCFRPLRLRVGVYWYQPSRSVSTRPAADSRSVRR